VTGSGTRVAAVDCGTNSVRLLVTDLDGGRQQDLLRRNEIVRLGQDVDRTGRLAPEALDRTRVALVSYAEDVSRLGAERLRMVATSATRDAANRADFVGMVQATLGVEPEVVTGSEEAALSFAGATRALAPAGPVLVCDIGGGSTELVRGHRAAEAALSVDIGCVRLAERHFSAGLPPSTAAVDALVADASAEVGRLVAAVPTAGVTDLLCLAGTATTVAALAMGLGAYDADTIHGARVTLAECEAVVDRLLALDREAIAVLPVMHPGRVDVITAGALVLRTVVRAAGTGSYVASESDILDGIAWSLLSD